MKYFVSQPTLHQTEQDLVAETLRNNRLTYGPSVQHFERLIADYVGTRYALCTTSGTTALHLAFTALGLGPGDEVLVPDLTYVSTADAVIYTGAKPVLVDLRPDSWQIDVNDARRKVTARTRAIAPVHLYGVACDMNAIQQLASEHGLLVVEDAAEGFSGEYYGMKLGALSDVGIFSFYGNKIITAGEGGAVVTNSKQLVDRMHALRGMAMSTTQRYFHYDVGFNYRMTDLQGALGIGQMHHLSEMLHERARIFALYTSRLYRHDVGVTPVAPAFSRSAPWVFTLQLNGDISRDELMVQLAAEGIETRPGFVPLHRMPMFLHSDREFPVACSIGDRAISLPTYPALTDADVHVICDAVVKHAVHGLQRS